MICLDVDGCLVDSRRMILESFQRALASLDLAPIEAEELSRYVGPPLHDTVRHILAGRGDHRVEADQLVAAYRDDFSRTSVAAVATYPGVPEAVTALAADHTLAVVTSKPIAFARPLLDALGLSSHFALMEGPDLAEDEAKPATLARALRRAGVAPGADHVMIGDREHDVAAGRTHGLRTIGVTWGFGSRDELERAGADEIIDHPDELHAAVASLAS